MQEDNSVHTNNLEELKRGNHIEQNKNAFAQLHFYVKSELFTTYDKV